MKKMFFSLVLLSQLFSNSIQANMLDALGQAVPHLLFLGNPLFKTSIYNSARAIAEKNCKKMENAKALEFIKNEISHILDHEIDVYVGNGFSFGAADAQFAFVLNDQFIVITSDYWAMLEPIFNKEELTEQDKKTLDIFKFIIQHECGHIKHAHCKKRIIAAFACCAASMALFEASKRAYTFAYSKRLTFFGLSIAGNLLQGALNIQQEYQADNGVKDEDAIEGGKQFFKNMIDLMNKRPEVAAHEKFNLTHPTCANRLKNLESKMQPAANV